jgi:hypothetical protein
MSVAEGGCNREQQGSKDTQSAPLGQGADNRSAPKVIKNYFNKQ